MKRYSVVYYNRVAYLAQYSTDYFSQAHTSKKVEPVGRTNIRRNFENVRSIDSIEREL